MIDTAFPTPVLTILAGGGGDAGEGSSIFLILMFGLLALFIFATWRRGRKMRDEARKANEGAVIGAEVVTAGGVVGRVVGRDDERQRITLEFSTGDRADFLLQAVQQITEPVEPEIEEPDSTDPTSTDDTDPR